MHERKTSWSRLQFSHGFGSLGPKLKMRVGCFKNYMLISVANVHSKQWIYLAPMGLALDVNYIRQQSAKTMQGCDLHEGQRGINGWQKIV